MTDRARRTHLQLLTEINRIVRLAYLLPESSNEEALVSALREEPLSEADAPRWLERLTVPWVHPLKRHSFGDVLFMSRYPFFATIPVPFTAIALRNGRVAVAFRAYVKKGLASVVLRTAANRLFSANDWSFPRDLADPAAFTAVSYLAFGNSRTLPFEPVRTEPVLGDNGRITLNPTASLDAPTGHYYLSFSPNTLGFYSNEFGLI